MAGLNSKFCFQVVHKWQKVFAFQRLSFRVFQHLRSHGQKLATSRYALSFALPSLLLVKAVSPSEKSAHSTVIKEADFLYDNGQFEKLHDVLFPYRGTENPEILWRLARAIFEKCRDQPKSEKLSALEESLELVNKALDLDETCWAAHKWRAILLDYVWRYKSTKGRIIHSFDVKKHMERAIELNPKDSTSYYLLGEWCFTFADMPWYQRKAASAIFSSPPTSTYEEALEFFEQAEKITPQFYSMNLLMIGKCYLKLKQEEKAALFLKETLNYPIRTADDRQAHEEAENILKRLNLK